MPLHHRGFGALLQNISNTRHSFYLLVCTGTLFLGVWKTQNLFQNLESKTGIGTQTESRTRLLLQFLFSIFSISFYFCFYTGPTLQTVFFTEVATLYINICFFTRQDFLPFFSYELKYR